MKPYSLYPIPLALLGYVLLAVPPVSMLLAMFGFTYLPPILLNLAALGTAAEVWWGEASADWLLFPLIWFAGFGALTVADRFAAWAPDRRRCREPAGADSV